MSTWEPLKYPRDHPDSAAIHAALYRSGAGTVLAGRTYIGDEPDPDGCLTVYQEASYEDMPVGLAVPDGDGGWYLGCTACRARLTGPAGGKCPACRRQGENDDHSNSRTSRLHRPRRALLPVRRSRGDDGMALVDPTRAAGHGRTPAPCAGHAELAVWDGAGEHLCRVCLNCGYGWTEACADQTAASPGTPVLPAPGLGLVSLSSGVASTGGGQSPEPAARRGGARRGLARRHRGRLDRGRGRLRGGHRSRREGAGPVSARPGALELPSPPEGLLLPVLPGALCKWHDPSLWFPAPGGSMDRAKAVCRACPARTRCLDWAVHVGERAGVWGGTTPDERAHLRRVGKGPDSPRVPG
jgi:WhiB family redox-sensing transcriptional regulator